MNQCAAREFRSNQASWLVVLAATVLMFLAGCQSSDGAPDISYDADVVKELRSDLNGGNKAE